MSIATPILSPPYPVGRVPRSTVAGLKILADILRDGRAYSSRRAIAAVRRLSSAVPSSTQRCPMKPPRLVAISGSVRRPSKTRALIEFVAAQVARMRRIDLRFYDLLDAGAGLGTAYARSDLPLPAARIVDAIETADALVVGSPVYKGSYTGLFKHLFDFVDPEALVGKPVILTATGGGPRHALIVEHSLRPLFGFFAALSVPTAVYASDADFREGALVEGAVSERAALAARQLVRLLDPPAEAPVLPLGGGRLALAPALWSSDR
jgi:FMN reductase